MDFYRIKERSTKNGVIEVYPDFKICRSNDIMVRGKSFYAIWDEEVGVWSTDEYDVQRLVDEDLISHREKILSKTDGVVHIKSMSDFSSRSWSEYRNYISHVSDNATQLDMKLTFANTEVRKKDYVSRRLPYSLEEGPINAYEEILGTLYDPEEREKIEWAIGAVVAGEAKDIQKFLVLYGEAGSGKSTVLNIIQKLFEGYYTTFEAKALTSSSNAFSTEVFKENPLVAIQHDGDLSRIEDNTKLNSIVSHEEMTMNEKYKPSYMARINAFLFMATNKPVKITDAKSGIIRRLIDVRPNGKKIPTRKFMSLISQIDFELGAIASHCLDIYRKLGKNYYAAYRPLEMMLQTDVFFNFIEAYYDIFKEQDGASLSQGYEMYKKYCDDSLVDFKLPRYKFREEFKNYFKTFHDRYRVNGEHVRSYYSGFLASKLTTTRTLPGEEAPPALVLDSTESLFDERYSDAPAQYASAKEIPSDKWDEIKTTLNDINTKRLHYVRPPINHIVIDFDLKDETGNKSLEKNIEAASQWPITYSEYSKSGKGLHLHYIYEGDVEQLSRIFEEGIEIKVFTGKSSLRRKLTKCNTVPIRTIKSGLPLKGEKMINFDAVKSEKALRDLIGRNLRKEIHPHTASSVSFIHKILEDAYESDLHYDVTDLRPTILAFANNSTNQAGASVALVDEMKFASKDISVAGETYQRDELIFFDVEVFPNLFITVWKPEGKPAVRMINPTAEEIGTILGFKLVGFNCRRYDNHILYARYLGYTNEELFILSQRIINGSRNGMFGEAYNISYTDVYDFSSKKQSLKKFEIELGIHHQELGLPWDQPVPEEKWDLVAEYCENDVVATEEVFKARAQDFTARMILSELSGLTPNDTTQNHTAKIIFGDDPTPQDKFIYTDLSETFPGYSYENGKSSYSGENPGEGGYVYSEPGMYGDVALLDIVSMHPTSLILLDLFGPYTDNFKQLVDARVAIKHKQFAKTKKMLGGILAKYVEDESQAEDLAYALKIVINSVYGLTSAKFDNKFKDRRNVDNIVAKRGSLFMIDLKKAMQMKGYRVVHIKTDSIKIPDATPAIINFVKEFGAKYGYEFEHETTFDKFCLVNDAVYIAKDKHDDWTAVGAQFAHPYVFKRLFSKEKIQFEDMCETKAVSTALYLDLNEGLKEEEHNYRFVGKVGSFCPIIPGKGGGILLREKEGNYHAATGSKGYRWLEAEVVKTLKKEDDIDEAYFKKLVDDAVKAIEVYGDLNWFISDEKYDPENDFIWPF